MYLGMWLSCLYILSREDKELVEPDEEVMEEGIEEKWWSANVVYPFLLFSVCWSMHVAHYQFRLLFIR